MPVIELPEVMYANFCGIVNELTAQKLTYALGTMMESKVKHLHLLFQSSGGVVGDGVFLYNYLQAVPIETTLYNCGQVASAGVTVFLGSKNRRCTKTSSFMVHSVSHGGKAVTGKSVEHAAKSVALDDERTEAIYRKHVNFTPEMWTSIKYHDVFLTGEEAVEMGIAESIADFAPPQGIVYSLIG